MAAIVVAATLALSPATRGAESTSTTTGPPPTTPPVAGSPNAPCHAVVEKYCHGVQPGGGRLLACLQPHRDEVPPECLRRLEAAQAGMGAGKGPRLSMQTLGACREDLHKLCSDISPGGGRLYACLKGKEAELSSRCRDAFGGTTKP